MKNLSIDISNKSELKVFECFAGIGSQHMALRNIGANYKIVGISEIDIPAIKSYNAIFGPTPNYGDISKIDANELPEIDLLTYSFPCQDLSVAGTKKGLQDGTRSSLLYECKKIIECKKPKYLLLENVKNLIGSKFKKDFDKWIEYLETLGYKNYYDVLNAKNFGLPQNRERVFCVSILGDQEFKFNKGYPTKKRIKDILEDQVDDKYILSDKIQNRFNQIFDDNGKHNIIGNTKPPFRNIGSRDNVYGINSIMGTLLASDYKQPRQIIDYDLCKLRKLTPKECCRLMGFNDEDYEKVRKICSDTQIYKQCGNSIAVPVLESIFIELLKGCD